MSNLGDDFCVRLYSRSPPEKCFYQGLTITLNDVTLNSWDISRGPHTYPHRKHMLLEEFCADYRFQEEISTIFGKHAVEYIIKLADGERSFHFLPEKLVLYILNMLAVNDILNLRQSSKIFFQVCDTNSVWKILFQKKLKRKLTDSELKQSEKMSWIYMLRRNLLNSYGALACKNFIKNTVGIIENIKSDCKSSTSTQLLLKSEDKKSATEILEKPVERFKKSCWSQKNIQKSKNKPSPASSTLNQSVEKREVKECKEESSSE